MKTDCSVRILRNLMSVFLFEIVPQPSVFLPLFSVFIWEYCPACFRCLANQFNQMCRSRKLKSETCGMVFLEKQGGKTLL